MKLHLLTLKFSGNSSQLEAPFLSNYYRVSLHHMRISLVLGALMYAAFGILDALLMPEQKSTIWVIRFVIVCPVLFATLLASFSKFFERYMQPLLACIFILAGGGIICMIVIAPPPINYSYYAGLLLVFMWGYTFIRIQFLWASLAGWVQVILYEIAAFWISPTPFAVLLSNNFFFISANVIGMLTCYSIEFYSRRDFFLTHQLEIEQEKVNKINKDLEERVEKRAVDYQVINQVLEQEIASRKLADAEHLRLATAIEQAAEGIYLTDTNWIIQYLNPAFEKMLGYDKGEMLGWHTRLLKSGKHDRIFYKNISGTLVGGKVWSGRAINKKKDGTFIDVDVTMSPVRDKSGNIINYVCIHRDITHEVALEDQLQRSQKMEAIGTLAGGIAHDFNNLLMGIQGYTSLALLNLDPDDPNWERLKRVEDQVQSGAELTKQLLGFARGGRYEVKPADMNNIIEKSSSMFGRTKKEITIHKKYENDLYPVEVDLGQMEQVFMNLYVNAWQAMPGGGNIYLETESVLLDEQQALTHAVKSGRYIKISVTDTGTGMDEKTKERIFDPFFTTKAMGRGTGLGLSTVYGIIKGHKGMIDVSSELGNGTTFTIYLPASEKEVVKDNAETLAIVKGKETIMLVDDEKMVLESNKEILELLGYKVYAFGSGQEAIAIYMGKSKEIDLVILDMIMPGISGGETFDHLREINPEARVLLSTGYSLNGEAQAIMDRGCKGFLQKPFQIEKLSQKVREMLS